MQEEVRAEVVKLLQAGIIYPISDSPWVSITQVVPKKSGITVVQNEKGEEVCYMPHFSQLGSVLNRCIEKDLVLNWEKCHFMVQQGIVLGHIISKKGIEVDKAKVELIVKLPSPTTVKGVRQFLGHAGFYRRFIKDFSKLSKPLCELLGLSLWFSLPHYLKYLLTKQDAKARLIRWILLLQEFNLQIKDKKGVENVVADHLSRNAPWYAHIANYLVTGEVPNQIIRKCVPEQEQQGILSHCHESACGGHFASQKTTMKVLQSGFSWPSLFKDAHTMCRSCDDMPKAWEVNTVVLKFLKENIFSRFGVPKAIINDGSRMKRCLDLNEMEELRNDAYINSKIAKQRMKRWHDQLISNKEFQKGQRVLLYDSRLHIFPGKLKSRWIGPFIIHQVHSNGVVELLNSNSTDTFKVNGHRLKPFMEPFNQDKEEVSLLEPQQS
ncbi:Retrovirus-related Pol polyprotein from transposon opus [Vitis vinifera]|uniref:Retrovirus-related Pol polyprotein from transposon opus n=1 Tax=Vitis vinifera TaxID=29760 RepID=A0A438CB51_VITVI|nr:Retrovirus-related Pol polyprotein from transposon opus [Vitis vinifera]